MRDDDVLPISSPQQDQERRSFARFQAIVPDRFIYREENGGDFGVDRILELRDERGAVTNFRVHVQGKSAKTLGPNSDGSFSYALPVKTINYLQRQLASIVFLYLEDRQVFKWAWVSDIGAAMRLSGEEPERRTTVTYQFTRALDPAAFDEIHATATRHGTVVARLADVVAASSVTSSPGRAYVSLAEGEVTDIDILERRLREEGFDLASSGLHKVIDDAMAKLPGRARDDAELQCIVAFSKLLQGDAATALSLVHADPEDEPSRQKQIRKLVQATARYTLGIFDLASYSAALESSHALAPDSALTAQLRLHELREELFAAKGLNLEEVLPRMRAIVEPLCHDPEVNEDAKLSAELLVWDIDALAVQRLSAEAQLAPRLRQEIAAHSGTEGPGEGPTKAANDRSLAEAERWGAKGEELQRRVASTGNLVFMARFCMSMANMLAARVAASPELADTVSPTAKSLLVELGSVARRLEESACFEIAARVEIVRSDLANLLGDVKGARSALETARGHARRATSRWLLDRVDEALAGRGAFALMQAAHVRAKRPFDPRAAAERTAALSASDRDRYTARLLRMLDLPPDRYESLRKGADVECFMANEALSWCRHLTHLEDKSEGGAIDPIRYCRCNLLDVESANGSRDILIDLERFKAGLCQTCPSRAPWNG